MYVYMSRVGGGPEPSSRPQHYSLLHICTEDLSNAVYCIYVYIGGRAGPASRPQQRRFGHQGDERACSARLYI